MHRPARWRRHRRRRRRARADDGLVDRRPRQGDRQMQERRQGAGRERWRLVPGQDRRQGRFRRQMRGQIRRPEQRRRVGRIEAGAPDGLKTEAAVGETIPIIDIGDFLAGRPGALMAAAHQVHDALTTTGFFVLTGHGVPQPLIARSFTEARRFHQLPLDKKLALKLNEHINGYMVMGRYAVRTSDINNNDKGDLNEAFFIKRERPPDDPLLRSGRRFVGPNLWPAESDLPGFRENLLEYAAVMDGLARRFLPVVAAALDLPSDGV